MKKTARRLLASAEFDSADDLASFLALLDSGIHPDAKTRARKGSLPRAPLWSLALGVGAPAFELLIERGCSFEPAIDDDGRPIGPLAFSFGCGWEQAEAALAAAERGSLGREAAPGSLWSGFAELLARICVARKLAEGCDERGQPEKAADLREGIEAERFGPLSDLIASARALHRRLLAWAGPACHAELLALSGARLHLPLALHLESRPDLEALAQPLCDARSLGAADARDRLLRDQDKALAAMAGSLLAPFAPSADLALDARASDALASAFAIACGAKPSQASEPLLAALVRGTCAHSRDPRSLVSSMAPILRIQQGAGRTELRSEVECAELYLAAGASCLGEDADGRPLREGLAALESLASLLSTDGLGLGALFSQMGLASKLGLVVEAAPVAQLTSRLRRAIEREELAACSARPDPIRAPSRAASL